MDRTILTKLINNNKSTHEIAKELSCSQSNIKYWILKFNLKSKRKQFNIKSPKCTICGDTKPENFYPKRKEKCKTCFKKQATDRMKETRNFAVSYLGNKCKRCGFDEFKCSLDIHHLVPSKKDKTFSSYQGWTNKRLIKELSNCILLCRNCHQAVHSNLCSVSLDG